MGAIVTVESGFDLGYVWINQGGAQPQARSPGGYYIDAAQGGEPPGRWFGAGAQALGFAATQLVDKDPYMAVYQQIHPLTGEKLGRARGNYARYTDHLARLQAAEPYATAERTRELEREAAKATRQSPAYTDMTVSFSKSMSVFHASLRENERRARLAGDEEAADYWTAAERDYQAILQEANRAALRHAQTWAGVTRTGHHGAQVDGQQLGRYEQAGLVVSSWLQGTSRDGDPQDHIHNQIARMAYTHSDGKWRAEDTMSLRHQLGAVQAMAATHSEAALTRRFGLSWVPRADGKGNEIAGVTQAEMDAYSSRAVTIQAAMPAAIEAWTGRYGREPNQRQLEHIKQEVTLATRHGKEAGVTDWDEYTARWATHWDETLGGDLAALAVRVTEAAQDSHTEVTQADLTRAVQRALVLAQEKQSTWTRSDLMKQLALALPPETRHMDPDAALGLLEELTDRALAGQVDPVVCLEAPEWPPLPGYLRRELDARSVYTRPGTTRYATRVQLDLEEQLVRDAQAEAQARLTREEAAAQLGADPDALEAELHTRAQEARSQATPIGLRLDQAAAVFHTLTSRRVAEVLVGPAGSGKTHALAEAARAWARGRPGGQVWGTATSQAATNELRKAGVKVTANTTKLIGVEGRGLNQIQPGSLIILDEGSMVSMTHLARIVAYAAANRCRVLIAGDQEQLTAVESGGGFMLLARRLGHVQLAEAVRFRARWERDASLRLRAGDASALDDYHAHGRIRGDVPDRALEDACKSYVASVLEGRDTLLMIGEWNRCREASRRIREDLIHYGIVSDGAEVTLAEGQRASVGDLIINRVNDHGLIAGERGRTLANGDMLRVEEIGEDGSVTVRRMLDADRKTGAQRFTRDTFRFRALAHADLAYAITGHSAQGRTVHTGYALITGTESRQWLYVAMTRGTDGNFVITFTRSPKISDPKPGTRPAPEIARHRRVSAEREGEVPKQEPVTGEPEPREPVAVVGDCLERDDTEESALELRRRNLANADHLQVLYQMWRGETDAYQTARYRSVVLAALPPEFRGGEMTSRQATWLYRTLRTAEAAGLDAAEVVAEAVAERDLTGTRDLARVLDARIRERIAGLVPQPAPAWSGRVPPIGDPAREEFVHALAGAMDARRERIGEHTAQTAPAWAVRALGPVPEEEPARLEWQQRASAIGSYRELYSFDHPTEAVGPEPTADSPEQRQHWHAAFQALGPAEGVDLRGERDGSLWHIRSTYEAVTGWAPRHVGKELQRVRVSAEQARAQGIRADAEAEAATEAAVGDRHRVHAESAQAMEAFYRRQEAELAEQDEARREWEEATRWERARAVAADGELRHRHPGEKIDPLRSAEPVVTEEDRLALVPGETYDTPEWIATLAAERRAAREKLDERKGVRVPAEDPDEADLGQAWPRLVARERDAILQPAKPEIRPAAEVLQRAAETGTGADTERER